MAKVVLTSKTKNFSSKDIEDAVQRVMNLSNFNLGNKIEKVVIKPNLCYYWDYSTGETTDPRVVSAVIDYIRREAGEDVQIVVAEADASAMRTKYSFDILGYKKLSQTKDVELVNLSDGDIVDRKVEVMKKEFALPINKTLLEADLIINVPKLKIHNIVGFTCCLKNMFGAISKPRKFVYHKMLPHVIVGVNKIIRSDICLVDGFIVSHSGPKKRGILIAGGNPLATDFIAAKIMGFNPKRIKYLNMAEKEKIGVVNDIELMEDNVKLSEVKKTFPRYNHFLHTVSWKLQLKMVRTYATLVGDVVPPVLEQ